MANATTTGTSTAVAPMTTGTCPSTAGIGGVFGSIAPLLLINATTAEKRRKTP